MKKILVSAASALVFYASFQAMGLGRERYVIDDVSYVYGDFKEGSIAFDTGRRFGPIRYAPVYENYEIEWETSTGVDEPLLCYDGQPFVLAVVEEGGWIDCRVGRCGRITVKQFFPAPCE